MSVSRTVHLTCEEHWLIQFTEQFSNGITIISLYLRPLPNTNAPPIENSIWQVKKEASLLFCLPDNPFFLPKSPGSHAVQEATYACRSYLVIFVLIAG